jgi:hypothetical protein
VPEDPDGSGVHSRPLTSAGGGLARRGRFAGMVHICGYAQATPHGKGSVSGRDRAVPGFQL